MPLFKIVIDEQLARFFWLQSMTKWSWATNPPRLVNREFNQMLLNFQKNNHQLLLDCRQLLQEEGLGTELIWKIYSKEIDVYKDRKYQQLKDLDKLFAPVFNIIWEAKLTNIIKWSETVDKFFTKKHLKFLKKIHRFLRSDFRQLRPIVVHPLLCSNLTVALMNKDYPDIILSQYDKCFKNDVTANKALLHEYVHIMQHSSKSDDMLRKAFTSTTVLNILKDVENAPNIAYAAREILVQSLVSTSSPSYYAEIFPNEACHTHKEQYYKPATFNNLTNSYNNWYEHFRIIAHKSLPMLINYIDQDRPIDQDYCDNLASLTIDYLNIK